MPEEQRPTVSIIIKAFNEERHIAGAIESALAALAGIGGEVILADGASTDRTVAIAEKYPVKIVRLDNAADRSCGAGAQLGLVDKLVRMGPVLEGCLGAEEEGIDIGRRSTFQEFTRKFHLIR